MAQLLGWKIEYDGVDARTSQCPGPQDSFKFSLARLLWTRPEEPSTTDGSLPSVNWPHFLKFYKNIAGKQNDMFGIRIFIRYDDAHLGQRK